MKILIKFWAEIKQWRWSHIKVKLDWRNSIIPIHWNQKLWKWLLLSILKQLNILENEKYVNTDWYKKLIEK